MGMLLGGTMAIALQATAASPAPPRTAAPPPPAAAIDRAGAPRTDSVRALLQRARLQSTRNDTAGSLILLRSARRLAPNSEEVLSAFGEAALAGGAPLEAVEALSILTRICPTVAGYHHLRGLALAHAGDPAAASESLEEADRLEPHRPATLIALGTALTARRLYPEAAKALSSALSLAPQSLEALSGLAEAEAGSGELQLAEAHAEQALKRNGEDATANLALGMVRMQQQRYEEARASLTKSLAAGPGSAKTHYQLSLACARLGDEAAAQRHLSLYRRAVEANDSRLRRVRDITGFSSGGMQP